jgi:hypothetical protein
MDYAEVGTIIWLIIAVSVMALIATEIAGYRIRGWHPISWWAKRNQLLRWLIIGLFLGGGIWFFVHTSYLPFVSTK